MDAGLVGEVDAVVVEGGGDFGQGVGEPREQRGDRLVGAGVGLCVDRGKLAVGGGPGGVELADRGADRGAARGIGAGEMFVARGTDVHGDGRERASGEPPAPSRRSVSRG